MFSFLMQNPKNQKMTVKLMTHVNGNAGSNPGHSVSVPNGWSSRSIIEKWMDNTDGLSNRYLQFNLQIFKRSLLTLNTQNQANV